MTQLDYRTAEELLDAWFLGLVSIPTMDRLAELLARPPQTVDGAVREILNEVRN